MLQKKGTQPVTLIVVPHSERAPVSLRIPTWLLPLFLVLSLAVSAGAGMLCVRAYRLDQQVRELSRDRQLQLVREREMENDYLVRLGRKPNHIFTRIAGSSTDAFTIGYYRDLKAYANPPEVTPDQEEEAAKAAGFRGAAFIGAYLRELILRHHDTLAVPIP